MDTKPQLSFNFAQQQGVLLTHEPDGTLCVQFHEHTKPEAILEVQRVFGPPARLEQILLKQFESLLTTEYEKGSAETMQKMEDLHEEMNLERIAAELPTTEDLLESEDDAPIIRLINALFTEAIKQNASDIHIETYESRLLIRFRIDGVLRVVLEPNRLLSSLVISRVKVMAKLDIAEKRLPQDGRISIRIAGRAVDVRVSTIPSSHGERVVLRLLDKQAGKLDLEHLGMSIGVRQLMDELIHKPHGIVLVTGPTGSGKTTTLYAALTCLNTTARNILTVEDPIEYYLEGIGQTQVNPKVDMTFARGLRAILRQDPDVVMVGEIRDKETAEIAVQASLTGHLVLSTLHTNTAVGALTRLYDIGIEPFLMASSLLGVLSQRLVRKLCVVCREPYAPMESERVSLSIYDTSVPKIYRARACPACNQTGYKGRSGIYELVVVDDILRNLIHEKASEAEMESAARKNTPNIRQDGRRQIVAGITTVDEVVRVTLED